MSRVIRLTSGALVVVCALASAAAAKPSIAVLGLEVIDKSGSPSTDDVSFAKNLTEGLRARAKIGGPYSIAPTGDKELIDLKLLKGCDDEKPTCMASIGGDLNTDFLIYGSVTKRGKNYEVSINFLDVHAGKREKTVPTTLPVGTNGVALQTAAKKIYNGLTGQSDACTITIKTPGVDRATILVNSKEAGNITNGVGSVNGLSEGRYSIAIEANGFHRYTKADVSCTGGETTNIQADMSKMDKAIVPPPDKVVPPNTATDGNHEITGTESHSKVNGWAYAAIGGGVVTAVGVGGFIFYKNKLNQTGGGWLSFNGGANCSYDTMTKTYTGKNGTTATQCADAGGWSNGTIAFGIVTGVAGAFTAFSIYKALTHTDENYEQNATTGRRVRREPFAITPVVGPDGASATFRMEW